MVSPLPEANAIVGLCSRCVVLLDRSRHGLLLAGEGRRADFEPEAVRPLSLHAERYPALCSHNARCAG
jgi:hypothetical protein